MENQIRVVLPKKYDLVVGDTFQLFYRGVIEAPNPYVYSIVAICDKGRNFPRYFEYTPTEPGEYKLTIQVYDAQRNLLGESETVLNVVLPKAPEKRTTILVIGDSLTGGGHWISEVYRRITDEEGTPAGLGFKDAVKFIGTSKGYYPEVASEGYGGWHWDSFLYNVPGAMWIECPNNRGVEDQHSLWQDCNGAIWQLETLQIDYLKFNRYKDHTSPRPEHGPLTHYANAIDTSPIEFKSSSNAGGSPFVNPETGKVDFTDYCKRNNFDAPDAVYIFLGSNGLMSTEAMTNTREEYCRIVVNKGKKLVGFIKEAFPNVKVKIMGLPLSSVNGGMGANYGAQLPLTNHYDIIHYKLELNAAYQAWCLEDAYKDFMEFINISGQFDCEYGYPAKQKPVNTRSEVTERVDTNAAHPTKEGYHQFADAVYRNIVASFCSD
ncbi:MAG: SGNH/GDSL hydrolase family protein [Oscillospiraceae bacterium]|nr:SGNH/GDSL hydrolase family protein [Oscillospiraceae bacterium]